MNIAMNNGARSHNGLRCLIFVHRIEPDAVAVMDLMTPGDPVLVSVTNDAEAVVAWLYRRQWLKPSDRLIYRDTEEKWDGMLHRGGKFAGFLMLRADETTQALERWDLANTPP